MGEIFTLDDKVLNTRGGGNVEIFQEFVFYQSNDSAGPATGWANSILTLVLYTQKNGRS